MKHTSTSLKETEELAKGFLEALAVEENRATVVCLYGDLGAGKTTFVQAVARTLGIQDTVNSPTFVIMKKYNVKPLALGRKPLAATTLKRLIHIDAYRLESGEELEKLSFKDELENPENLIFIEWPEHVKDILPDSCKELHFKFIDENTREITYD